MNKVANVDVRNLIEDREESLPQTINRWKKENKLELLEYTDEQIVKERLNLLYKIQNKKEEREIKVPKIKVLFEIK